MGKHNNSTFRGMVETTEVATASGPNVKSGVRAGGVVRTPMAGNVPTVTGSKATKAVDGITKDAYVTGALGAGYAVAEQNKRKDDE